MPQIPPGSPGGIFSTPAGGQAFPYGEGGRAQALTDEGCPATENKGAPMYLRPRTVGRLPCVKGAVGRRLTEGSAKAFLLNRVLSKHPALSIPPSRLRRATSLYAREAASGGGGSPHPSRAAPGPPSPGGKASSGGGGPPHPSRAAPGPPSPWGKASSGGLGPPHPSRAAPGPPSPEGKAASGGGRAQSSPRERREIIART